MHWHQPPPLHDCPKGQSAPEEQSVAPGCLAQVEEVDSVMTWRPANVVQQGVTLGFAGQSAKTLQSWAAKRAAHSTAVRSPRPQRPPKCRGRTCASGRDARRGEGGQPAWMPARDVLVAGGAGNAGAAGRSSHTGRRDCRTSPRARRAGPEGRCSSMPSSHAKVMGVPGMPVTNA